MLHSLRFRLIVMTLVVAVIAVACVGLLSRRFTLTEFYAYVTKNEETDMERFRTDLMDHYQRQGSWEGAQALLDRIGRTTDKQLVLVDTQRKPLATFPADLLQANIRVTPEHDLTWSREQRRDREVIVDEVALRNVPNIALNDSRGNQIGALYVAPMMPPRTARKEDAFVSGLNRALLLATLASSFVALLVAIILSRRILHPVEALTGAVRRMERGDLSQRVKASSKDEIGELAHAFNAMADSLARAEQLRQNMVNDVAHELRTPLTNIRCQIETLQDGLTSPTPEVITSLHEEAMLLNRLIDDLQDLALAEAGQLSLRLDRVSVLEDVTSAVNAVKHFVGSVPSIKIDIPKECPDVLADSKRLGQVLRNLLNNAITHTPADGEIIVRASQVDSSVELAIEDTGIGIAPEDLPYVFERFYRADASRDRATGGAGLGLAIVKQIVAAHSGKIRIESAVGSGTRIYFTLPVFESHE